VTTERGYAEKTFGILEGDAETPRFKSSRKDAVIFAENF